MAFGIRQIVNILWGVNPQLFHQLADYRVLALAATDRFGLCSPRLAFSSFSAGLQSTGVFSQFSQRGIINSFALEVFEIHSLFLFKMVFGIAPTRSTISVV